MIDQWPWQICRRCRCARRAKDMGHIDDIPYCHPEDSTGDTCYMLQGQVLAEFWKKCRS